MLKLTLFFGILVGISHFEGGLVTLFCEDRIRYQILQILQPFCSGALICLALIHLIPMSLRLASWAPFVILFTLCGLMILYEFGNPNQFFISSPNWGQTLLMLIYSSSIGILITLGMWRDLHIVLIGTIVAIPVQFIQAFKNFIQKRRYLLTNNFLKSLFISSLVVPLTIIALSKIPINLDSITGAILSSFLAGAFLFQGIMEFQTCHPQISSILKITYFITGIVVVYCI